MTKAVYAISLLVVLVASAMPAYVFAETTEPVLSFSGISSTGTQEKLLSFIGENFGASDDIIVVVSDSSDKNIADMEIMSTKDGLINLVISMPSNVSDEYKIVLYASSFSMEYNYFYDGASVEFLNQTLTPYDTDTTTDTQQTPQQTPQLTPQQTPQIPQQTPQLTSLPL